MELLTPKEWRKANTGNRLISYDLLMNEYAEYVAKAFAEWSADNEKYVRVKDENGNNVWIDQDTPESENNGEYYQYATSQLYLDFKNKE